LDKCPKHLSFGGFFARRIFSTFALIF